MRFQDDPIWRHVGSPTYTDHDTNGFMNLIELSSAATLITGSSHVYGTNLQKLDTWPIQLQSSGINLYSAAMGAWSLMQFALVARTYLHNGIKRLHVYIYLGFDVYATLRHTVETRAVSKFGFFQDADLKLGLDWRRRTERDEYLKECARKGLEKELALRNAHAQDFEDCYPVTIGDSCWWVEPQLRAKTTSLETPYMARALDLSKAYIFDIIQSCRVRNVDLRFTLMPTKEAVLARRSLDLDIRSEPLLCVLKAERILSKEIQSFSYSKGVECCDLFDFYLSVPAESMFCLTPFEGHPSIEGAKLLAAHMRSWM